MIVNDIISFFKCIQVRHCQLLILYSVYLSRLFVTMLFYLCVFVTRSDLPSYLNEVKLVGYCFIRCIKAELCLYY